MWCMWKTCFLCFKINYFNYLYFHSMSWLVCWVVSDLLRQEWLKGWKGNIQKWKESTKWSFWRNWQRRERVTDAIARYEQNADDADAWPKRTRDKENSRWRDRVTHADAWPTRTRDPRGRVTEATHQKLQNTPPANSEALFGPDPSTDSIDQRL